MLVSVIVSGCRKLEETEKPVSDPPPVFTITTEGNISVPAGGGDFSINYTVDNPAEDGKVGYDTDADWIDAVSTAEDGIVSFTVLPNPVTEIRETEIILTYVYKGGDPQTSSVKITQGAKDADPVIAFISSDTLEVGPDGGSFSIQYRLDNPAEDGEIGAGTQTEWISDLDWSSIGTVMFTVAVNDTYEQREGEIVITYHYAEKTLSLTLTLVQKCEDVFSIQVTDISSTSARIISSCRNHDLRWTSSLMPKSTFDSLVVTKDNMPDYYREFLESTADYYRYSLSDYLRYYVLYSGDFIDDFKYSNLEVECPYMTFAVGMDYDGNYTTDFYWGPEFSTTEVRELLFDISVTPKVSGATLDIAPTDLGAYYFATVIDESFYDAGYTDEMIMEYIIRSYGIEFTYYLNSSYKEMEVTGLLPSTQYYAIAFGIKDGTWSSKMASEPFRTLENSSTDAYATASMDNYWFGNDLVAYNPEYEFWLSGNEDTPLMAALDIEFNGSAVGVYYKVWKGDLSSEEELLLFNNTVNGGTLQNKGAAANFMYTAYDTEYTVCTVAVDSDGNLGDLSVSVVTFTEEGTSHDYSLFDEYFNDFIEGLYPELTMSPAIMSPESFR